MATRNTVTAERKAKAEECFAYAAHYLSDAKSRRMSATNRRFCRELAAHNITTGNNILKGKTHV